MSIYASIQTGLETHLAAITDIPTIARENYAYAPTTVTKPFVSTLFEPAKTMPGSLGVGGTYRFQGLFRADVFYPRGKGSAAANAIVDLIVAGFGRSTAIVQDGNTIRVESVWRTVAQPNNDWLVIPVTISWFSYIAN